MAFEDLLYPLLKTYTASPQWIKSTVGRGYAMLPPNWRYGRAFRRFADELSVTDPDQVRAMKRAKLADILQWAVATVPAYRHLRSHVSTTENPYLSLANFPLISKNDVKSNLDGFVSRDISPSQRLQMFTGGSTAEPMRFFLQRGVTRSREFAYTVDFNNRTGLDAEAMILALRGRSIPGAGANGSRLWMIEPIKRHLILSSDHLTRSNMPDYIQALRQWRPKAIQAFPSALYPLALWLQEHPAPEVTLRIRSIHLTSETVYPHQAELFRSVFACPIYAHYGHSERVLFGASLLGDHRYLFWPLYGHLELVDPAGRLIEEPGVLGEIVGTGFDNRVMPFIRYRTGDFGMWSPEQQTGHPGWQTLEKIEGRLQEFVVCKDGRLISVCSLGAAHFEDLSQIAAIQYAQCEVGRVVLKIQADSVLPEAVMNRISKALESKMQGGCSVTVRQVQRIDRTARGKLMMVEQKLDVSTYFGAAHHG